MIDHGDPIVPTPAEKALDEAFEKDDNAFWKMYPDLVKNLLGKKKHWWSSRLTETYVAIHNGKLVAHCIDPVKLHKNVSSRLGEQPFLIRELEAGMSHEAYQCPSRGPFSG